MFHFLPHPRLPLSDRALQKERFFDKLLELDGDIGGKKILKENLDSLKIVPVQAGELQDIDRKEDLGTA